MMTLRMGAWMIDLLRIGCDAKGRQAMNTTNKTGDDEHRPARPNAALARLAHIRRAQ